MDSDWWLSLVSLVVQFGDLGNYYANDW